MTPEFLLSKVITIRNGIENVTLGIEKIIDWWVLLCIYIKYKPWYDEISYNYGPYTSLRTWNCQLVGWERKGIQLRRKNNQKTTLNQLLPYYKGIKYFLGKEINYIIMKYFHAFYKVFSHRKVLSQLLTVWDEMLMSLKRFLCISFTPHL